MAWKYENIQSTGIYLYICIKHIFVYIYIHVRVTLPQGRTRTALLLLRGGSCRYHRPASIVWLFSEAKLQWHYPHYTI